MANLLNAIIANQSLNKPNQQIRPASFTFDTKGKIKPLEDKAVLLPSRIIGSPIEYAKDFKKDIVSIGKAAKGKANDHELGRINDLAMKLGSLALASYLFVKNPLKQSKAMEFVGFGTFFASMALWPKLFIQAPLKARTGVDIHQKYIDSQGRKKMLHQDPQYDLTDLYSRKDLDNMGRKLGVNENLPDRDNFIKQRAKKTAVQGNTLWMMTAGLATPTMSALACNLAEQPVTKGLEKLDLKRTKDAMKSLTEGTAKQGLFEKLKQSLADKSLASFLKKNADKPLNEKMVKDLSARLAASTGSPTLTTAIAEELKSLGSAAVKDENFLRNALSGQQFNGSNITDMIVGLSDDAKAALNNALNSGSNENIANVLSQNIAKGTRAQRKLSDIIKGSLDKTQVATKVPTIGEATGKIKELNSTLKPMSLQKRIIDKFIEARVGDRGDTYIANQWERISKDFIKGLKLKPDQLKSLSEGKSDSIQKALETLAKGEQYDDVVTKLVESITKYETQTGSALTTPIQNATEKMSEAASKALGEKGFTKLAKKLAAGHSAGTIGKLTTSGALDRAQGAQNSLYRLLQTLEIFKKAESGALKDQFKTLFAKNGEKASDAVANELIKLSKQIMVDCCTTDHIEKLRDLGVSPEEYKKVLTEIFKSSDETIMQVIQKKHPEAARTMLQGFGEYKDDFLTKVAGWRNEMSTELSRNLIGPGHGSLNGVERSTLVGKQTKKYISEAAQKTLNASKWKKIWITAGVALAAATVIATFFIGRKTKIEKQLEEEGKGKVNG